MIVYVGAYTSGTARGIYAFDLDSTTGALKPLGVTETPNPSFLAVDPRRRCLYAVNELREFEGERTGTVSAFAIDRSTGALRPLNRQPSRGADPCHLTVDATGRCVLVANYSGGTVAALPIRRDGSLAPAASVVRHRGSGPHLARQESPHPHAVYPDPTNAYAIVADLGLDQVLSYRLDPETARLSQEPSSCAAMAPASGPRHVAFHPSGKWAYVISEMGNSVTACAYDRKTGALTPFQTLSTLPAGFAGASTTAEIAVHPSGRFVYGSNRGHDSIAVFSVDAETGKLRLAGSPPSGGKNPRGFAIDPTGAFLLAGNQDSGSVVVFRIDPDTGLLRPTGSTAHVGSPACVLIVPE